MGIVFEHIFAHKGDCLREVFRVAADIFGRKHRGIGGLAVVVHRSPDWVLVHFHQREFAVDSGGIEQVAGEPETVKFAVYRVGERSAEEVEIRRIEKHFRLQVSADRCASEEVECIAVECTAKHGASPALLDDFREVQNVFADCKQQGFERIDDVSAQDGVAEVAVVGLISFGQRRDFRSGNCGGGITPRLLQSGVVVIFLLQVLPETLLHRFAEIGLMLDTTPLMPFALQPARDLKCDDAAALGGRR